MLFMFILLIWERWPHIKKKMSVSFDCTLVYLKETCLPTRPKLLKTHWYSKKTKQRLLMKLASYFRYKSNNKLIQFNSQLLCESKAKLGRRGVHIREREQLGARRRGRERRASGHPWAGNRPHRRPRSKWISRLRGRSSKKIPCWCCHRLLLPFRCKVSFEPETHREWCRRIQRCYINHFSNLK